MTHHFRSAIRLLLLFTVLTGLLYPALVTGLSQLLFPHQANGSLVFKNGMPAGSELVGQAFNDPKYFWSRPSATSPYPYNAAASGASNLAPTNPDFIKLVEERVKTIHAADPQNDAPIPVDLAMASGSGLDPHISVAAAHYQVDRVARARGTGPEQIQALVNRYTEARQFGIFGEPRVNVLLLNLALDDLQ